MPQDPLVAAGFWRRLAAAFYDGLLLFALWMVATAALLPFTGGTAIDHSRLLVHLGYQLYLVLVAFGFFGYFWTHGGQTLGMRAWRVRLLGEDGTRISWSAALIRFVTTGLSLLTLGTGFLWMLIDRHHLTWHDRLSHTRVIRVDRGVDR